MVFQSYTLFPWLTVEDNIRFGLREQAMAEPRQREIARHYIERVGLAGFERHYPRMLSGGMQQRTAIARALANDPRILLLDEPFGALDHQTRGLMQELLLSVWESERKTVLFVTHDIEEAIFMANRVVVMSARPGKIKEEVKVTLDHPRHYTMKTTPEFSALKAHLTEQTRVEALHALPAAGVLANQGAAGTVCAAGGRIAHEHNHDTRLLLVSAAGALPWAHGGAPRGFVRLCAGHAGRDRPA
jgi:NitT/TauT family transport system ATP-binding protein/sulfonate transport system ATP-binding protein